MLEEEMKVGPKGQVVIPKSFRKILKILPGSKVNFRLEGDSVVIEKVSSDSVDIFNRIAHSGSSVKKISPHEYEAELAGRNPSEIS